MFSLMMCRVHRHTFTIFLRYAPRPRCAEEIGSIHILKISQASNWKKCFISVTNMTKHCSKVFDDDTLRGCVLNDHFDTRLSIKTRQFEGFYRQKDKYSNFLPKNSNKLFHNRLVDSQSFILICHTTIFRE